LSWIFNETGIKSGKLWFWGRKRIWYWEFTIKVAYLVSVALNWQVIPYQMETTTSSSNKYHKWLEVDLIAAVAAISSSCL
jgi:hypothetical protein